MAVFSAEDDKRMIEALKSIFKEGCYMGDVLREDPTEWDEETRFVVEQCYETYLRCTKYGPL